MNKIHHPRIKAAAHLAVLLSLLSLASCNGSCDFSLGLLPEKVSPDDSRLKAFHEAIDRRVDRPAMGFTPVPRGSEAGDVRVEWRPREGYDAMLHLVGKTSRTVAFKRTSAGYEWLGEQERFEGPNTYESVDGRFKESITLTYHLRPMQGPVDRLVVSYWGDEPALSEMRELSLRDVEPWLQKWGYR
jgi:hypothetical protein